MYLLFFIRNYLNYNEGLGKCTCEFILTIVSTNCLNNDREIFSSLQKLSGKETVICIIKKHECFTINNNKRRKNEKKFRTQFNFGKPCVLYGWNTIIFQTISRCKG